MESIQKHSTGDEINHARQSYSIGLTIGQKEAKVSETSLDQVHSFVAPTELFYVRSHSPASKLELAAGMERHTFPLPQPGRFKARVDGREVWFVQLADHAIQIARIQEQIPCNCVGPL